MAILTECTTCAFVHHIEDHHLKTGMCRKTNQKTIPKAAVT